MKQFFFVLNINYKRASEKRNIYGKEKTCALRAPAERHVNNL